MKKYTTLIILLLTSLTYSQELKPQVIFTFGVDPRNLGWGSPPTDNEKALDFIVGVKLIGNKPSNNEPLPLEFGFNYEQFKRIGFYKLGAEFGWLFKVHNRIRLVPSMETAFVRRQGNVEPFFKVNQNFIVQSANLSVRTKVVKDFFVSLKGGYSYRGDLRDAGYSKVFVFNGTVELVYCIEFN